MHYSKITDATFNNLIVEANIDLQNLNITGDLNIAENAIISGDISASQNLTVQGDTSLNNNLFVKGDALFSRRPMRTPAGFSF